MAVLDPEELFEQAELLIAPRQPGPPRQVDVRRAISAAYYAVFHHVCTQAADLFVGSTARTRREARYGRVYRTVDHSNLATLCRAVEAARLDPALVVFAPDGGFSGELKQFATDTLYLKAQRHRADYDPSGLLRTIDARTAISRGRRAISRYRNCAQDEQSTFLTLLVFKGR